MQHFIQYYTSFLGTPAPTTCRVRTEVLDIGPRLNIQQQVALIKPFSMADVKDAVFSIHDAKSPGFDGYSSGFFKKNWNIVGKEISDAILEFFSTGRLLKDINHTVPVLLAKKENPLQKRTRNSTTFSAIVVRKFDEKHYFNDIFSGKTIAEKTPDEKKIPRQKTGASLLSAIFFGDFR